MNFKLAFIAVFLLIGAISAVPRQHNSERTATCSSKCLNHENNLFREIGSTHHFDYKTNSEIELENGQRTQVQLRAKVEVSTISRCEHQIQLRKVQIDGPKETEVMRRQLEKHSTKFAQDNGRIEQVCFDENEETWVLNLKKSILSTLQVSQREQTEKMVEKDVLGYCNTQYEQISSTQIQKTKFLGTCTKRMQNVNSILTGDLPTQKKSVCKIELDNQKQLQSVRCEEENPMLPFASSKASGQIKTVTKLALEKVENSLSQVNHNKRLIKDSLVFNKKHHVKHSEQESREIVQEAERILDQIRSNVQNNIQKDTPEQIRKLSQQLAHLNVKDLERLAEKVSNKDDKVQDIFFDTVAQTGTQESAHIILKVILDNQFYKGQISKVRSTLWLSMLSNVEQVSEDALSIVAEHIRKDNLPRHALFALANMIDEIKDDEHIKQDSRYKKIVNDLIEKLHRTSEEKEKIAILKALRSTGVHHEMFEKVLQVAKDQSRNVETRIAAVQALEEHVTEDRFYQQLKKIFENESNKAELRIAAFQVLVQNQEKVQELHNILKTESNKQVGSYVVSFLKNARKSQLSSQETLRRIASSLDLPEKRFERSDFRQSKHIQFTQQIESLNVDAQVEADLVFDEQKELRNVRARFDLNKEQEQLKSVEITVRQNGLPEVAQQVVEQLARQTNLNKIVEEVKEFTSIRSKDELNRKMNKVFQLFNLNKIDLSSRRIGEQADASIHIRVQDKTVLYLNMRDIQEFASTLQQKYNQREQIFDQIIEKLTGDNALTLILSNKQHKMPTAHGLPIHSGHSLVIVAGLKTENGHFLPSIATDLHYEMGFSIMNKRPSVHYHVQLASAPGLQVNVERKNGVPTKLSVQMPEDRLEIVSVRSTVRLQTATEEVELNVTKDQRKGCTKLFNKVLGVELCHQTTYPKNIIEKNALNALFNGPFEFALRLEKTDSSIRKWELTFETPLAQREGQPKTLHLAFRTVGSSQNREVSMKVELQNERDSKIVNIDLRSPVKSAKIEGRAQWTQKNIGLKAALIMDNQRFEAQIGGERINENGEYQIRPSVKLTIPGMKRIEYTGKVALVQSGKKENFSVELKNSVTEKPLIKFSVIKSGKFDASENFKLATDLHAFWFTGSSIRFVSNLDKNSNGALSDFLVIHTLSNQAPTTYKWKMAMKDLSSNQVQKYNADLELSVPNTDFENVAVSWNFVNKIEQEIESELTAFWNNENGQKTRQVHILQQLKMNKISAKISSLFENLLKVEIKPLSVNYEVQAKTNWQRTQQKYNVQLTARDVNTNKQYKGDMVYQLSQQAPLKMELEAKIQIENNEFKIQHNIDEQEKNQYHGRTMVQLKKGQHIEFNYLYKMREHSLQVPRLNHELELEAKIPSKQITIKHKSGLKLDANQFELKHSLRKNNAVVSDVKISINKNSQSQLLADNPMFQVKLEGDLSQQNKQINVLINGKQQYKFTHQTKLNFNGKKQFQLNSQTTKNSRQVADVQVDYLKNQKAEAKIQIEKVGDLKIQHQPNGQQWANVEISSDYFSRPIRQQFAIEKQSNKYTIKSKTQQNQQIVGDFDLEIGSTSQSPSSLRVSAWDWKLTGQTSGDKRINVVVENNKNNLREELELQYSRNGGKVEFKHSNDQQKTSTLSGKLSWEEESRVQFNNEHTDVEFSMKPTGQQKHIKLQINDKKHNMQHKSELRKEESALIIVLEHSKDNRNVLKHSTKLSMNDDSHTRTETKRFNVEAHYRKNSGINLEFSNENGLKHSSKVEIIDLRNKVARITSSTSRNGQQIMNIDLDIDSWKKIDAKIAHQQQEKEMKLRINLKDQQKHVIVQTKCNRFEVNSKWEKESHKDHKYTLEIVDKKQNSNLNVLAHHQRKTMLNIKIDGSKNGQQHTAELKLHRNGEAFFKVDGKNMKLRTELNFAQSPIQAKVSFDSKKHSIQHETIATFLQQENELKIKSKTHKNSKQIANVDFRINPTTKQISASGEIDNKNLKIEGNINQRFLIKLENQEDQFKHVTELDVNSRNLRSQTTKQGKQLHKMEVKLANRRDVEGSFELKEHEVVFKTNEYNNQFELHYNNQKIGVKSTGHYTFRSDLINVQIKAQQNSKQLVDLDARVHVNQQKIEAKLNVLENRSSLKIDLSQRRQWNARVEFENQERNQLAQFSTEISSSEQQMTAKVHTKNLKIEKQIRLINGQELKIEGQVEKNGQKLVQGNVRIAAPFHVEAKAQFNTRDLKGQASIETQNQNEIRIEFQARDSQDKKVADLKSKLTKFNNKIQVNVDFDSQRTTPYTLVSELRKESEQLVMNTQIKSKEQKVGKFDARIRLSGLTLDAKVEGDLTINGKRQEVIYKLNNVNDKLEHALKIKRENYVYGFDITVHLKQGKFVIHLPTRMVEVRYDVSTHTNGHIIVNLDLVPDVQHEPNNVYNMKFDNLISWNNQELILNTRTTVHHPHINHPIEMVFRTEMRQPSHQRPLVLFVSYDASSNQQNRVSALFEMTNEQQLRVAHFNISHQNQAILDVHYRWAMNLKLVHQQLTWAVLNQNTQKVTGELLAQINLKQRHAKIELNNKHKLQMTWERSFDKNVIVQVKAQTDNLVRKVKIVSNGKQIEITNFENEKMRSAYIVSALKVENTLFAIEMHKKQNNKLEKVAFIQLVKDSLNYAKVHVKVEKSLVYEAQTSMQQIEDKIRSVARKHSNEIRSIARQQYQNMKLDEQTENTSKLVRKAKEDLKNIADDYVRFLQKYLPNVLEAASRAYRQVAKHLQQVWNLNVEEMINEIVSEIAERINQAERQVQRWVEKVERKTRELRRQYREIKEKINHEVIEKLSQQIEENVNDAIEFAEEEGEKVYEFLHRALKQVKLNRIIENIRSTIVNVKNAIQEIKLTKVHNNLHQLIYSYENKFEGKFEPRNGEMIAKIYFPTFLSKWSN